MRLKTVFIIMLFLQSAVYSELSVSNTISVKPVEPPRPAYAPFAAFSMYNGARLIIEDPVSPVLSYRGYMDAEISLEGSPFGLRAGLDLSPELGIMLGARLYFGSPFVPYLGVRTDILFSYMGGYSLSGTAGLETGWRIMIGGKDSRGGSFFLEPHLALDGRIIDFSESDPDRTNVNGFFVRDFRPSIGLAIGYIFY